MTDEVKVRITKNDDDTWTISITGDDESLLDCFDEDFVVEMAMKIQENREVVN